MTDMEQLLAVAKMYYEQGLTQQEIADLMLKNGVDVILGSHPQGGPCSGDR